MAILSKGTDFTTGDQVTAAKLDALVDSATFASGAVDDSTTALDGSGRIIVKDGGITSAKLNLTANVGINTSNPEAALHVNDIGSTQPCILVENASSTEGDIAVSSGEALQMGHWSGSAFTNRFQFNNTGVAEVFGSDSTGNSILILNSTGTDDTSALMFSNQADGDDDVGQISYDHTTNTMKFRANAAERATLDSAGTFEPTLALKCSGINLVSTFAGSDLVTSTNIDHMWYDDGGSSPTKGTFHFVADTTYHATGNADCRARVFTADSDYRLKENIKDIEDSISKVQSLKPINFSWIATGETQDGFIAHEVQEVVPLAVNGSKDEVREDGTPLHQGLDQSKLIPILTKALQEALTKIESLEARVASLES